MTEPSRFWDWAVAVYGRPGVQDACLALQDGDGQSVPYLLWAAWMAAVGRAASEDVLRQGVALACDWETQVVAPLRHVRRRLKGEGAHRLRDHVKAAELQAEQMLMQRLEALASTVAPPREIQPALCAAVALWPRPACGDALDILAAALR